MKWCNLDAPTQYSADRRYCIVRAVENVWHAYYLPLGATTGEQLGVANSDEFARQLCEDDEPLRRRP